MAYEEHTCISYEEKDKYLRRRIVITAFGKSGDPV